jgi:hypothetical protein
MDAQSGPEDPMTSTMRILLALAFAAASAVCASADQTPALNKVMRAKLGHSQAILAAVVTSDWAALDRESRALALAVRDPAWTAALTEPEYIKQSDAFSRALQDLIEASARRDLEAAGTAHIMLTTSCVRCHLHMTRRRNAR